MIGSHLVDALVERGAVVEELTGGTFGNIADHVKAGRVRLAEAALRETGTARAARKDIETVFHLAADHGGSVDGHPAGPASNLFLETNFAVEP